MKILINLHNGVGSAPYEDVAGKPQLVDGIIRSNQITVMHDGDEWIYWISQIHGANKVDGKTIGPFTNPDDLLDCLHYQTSCCMEQHPGYIIQDI